MTASQPSGSGALWSLLSTLTTNVLNIILSIVTGVLAARLLLPEGRGQLAEILFWGTTILALSMMALPTVLAMEVARDPRDRSFLSSALALAAALSGVAVVLFLCVGPMLVEQSMLFASVACAAVIVPAGLLGQTIVAVDHGNKAFLNYNAMRLVPPLVYLLAMVTLWAAGAVTAPMLAMANAAASLAVVMLKLGRFRDLSTSHISVSRVRHLLYLGASMHAASVLSLVLQRADQAFLIYSFDHGTLGNYSVAMTVSGVGIGAISSAVLTVYIPHMSAATDDRTRCEYVRGLLGITLLIALVVGAAMAALSPWLIPIVFGEAFAAAIPITVFLCVAQVPFAYSVAAGIALRLLGEWRVPLLAPVFGLLAFLPSVAFFAPRMGAIGIAIALAIAWTAAMTVLISKLRRILGISTLQCLLPPTDLTRQQGARIISPLAAALGWMPK